MVPFLARSRDFSLVQTTETSTGAHLALYQLGTRPALPGYKAEAVHSPPSSTKVKNDWKHTSISLYGVQRGNFYFVFYITDNNWISATCISTRHIMLIFINISAVKNIRSISTHLFTLDIISFMYWLFFDCCNIHPSFLSLNELKWHVTNTQNKIICMITLINSSESCFKY